MIYVKAVTIILSIVALCIWTINTLNLRSLNKEISKNEELIKTIIKYLKGI